jgi:3-dehydroquinate synthase
MKKITIQGISNQSEIMVGEEIGSIKKYLPGTRLIIITDSNVYSHYADSFPEGKVIKIGTGEKIKTLDTVISILKQLTDLEADRTTFLLGIGGGIVCDITGFVASTYLRGVRFGFVSTTLLSQVDASVGGKNGVNFEGYKNMVGVFNQPDFVICDPNVLRTLPEKELENGCAEIVKHAAIADDDMFTYMENSYKRILELDRVAIEKLIYESVIIKSRIVNKDEKEEGERRKLNFGHTIGHAIEKVSGSAHGEAISAGMVTAAWLSEKRGYISSEERERIERLLKSLKLPIDIKADRGRLIEAIKRDKKREGDSIHFVLLRSIGEAFVEEIAINELIEAVSI